MKERLDFIFNKMLPKKFIVWLVAFIVFICGYIDASQFTTISVAYISANLISKFSK